MNSAMASVKSSNSASPDVSELPRVLLIGPSLRIMGGQAVMADRMVRAMREDGVEIDFLPINPRLPRMLQFAERIKGLRTLVVSTFYVRSLIRSVPNYDVIHLFSASYLSFVISQAPAILIARLFRKPLILNYRSGEAEGHLQSWGRSIFWILRMADRIVTPSPYLVDVFSKFGFEATHIHNVIDPTVLRYRLRREATPRIIVPRTLEPLYNVACAIRAFQIIQRQHPNAELTIMGDGSQRSELESLVRELQLRDVRFVGRIERSKVGELYDRHDILLNTTSIDNMPVSILEGFAAGLPIVTTNAGGIPYLIEDRKNAHLVQVNDHVAIAERVHELVSHPSEVQRLSSLGQEEVRKYLWENVAADWYELYRDTWKPRDTGSARA